MPQCLIYCRVSTEEQAEKGYSLDTQEKLCRDFAERGGFHVAGVYRDEGKSGTTLERPALQDLLAKCTKGTVIQAVIVQETDRLARNTHDHLTIRALLQKVGVKLISVAQPMLDDSPEGNMIDTILASVNQFQSDINSRKTRKALQEKFNQGWWPAWAPLGYVNVAIDQGDGGRSRKIVRNDSERWHLLKEGFSLYLTGAYSADALRDLLYAKGLRSKTGKRIAHSIMVNVLKNPFYAGRMVWKGQRKTGRHEPMITMPEHERVLEIIAAHHFHVARSRKHRFLLRGFVFCGLCGQQYTAEHHPAKGKSYYHCATMQGHSNRNQNIQVAELERQVEEQFKTIQFSPDFIERIIKQLRHVHDRSLATENARRQVLLNQQKGIEAKLGRAEEKLLAGVLPDDSFIRLRTNLGEQVHGIQAELAALDDQRESDSDVIRHVLQMAQNVSTAYTKAPETLKRHYLGLFWDRFVVQDRQIVKAIPTDCIRLLLEAKAVINSNAKLHRDALEETTISTMELHFKHLVATLGEKFTMSTLTLAQMQEHATRRKKMKGMKGKVSPATIHKELVTLRTAWNWGVHMGYLTGRFPAIKRVKMPKQDDKPPFQTRAEIERRIARGALDRREIDDLWDALYLRPEEIAELLAFVKTHAFQPWVYPLICTAAHTGSRRSELLRIDVPDVDINSDSITIHERKREHGKRTTRRVSLTPFLKTVLLEWIAVRPEGPVLFCQHAQVVRSKTKRTGSTAVTRDEAHNHFKQTLSDSKWAVVKGFHTLRHSFISCLASAGVDQRIIDDFVGHQTDQQRRRYRHIFPDVKQDAITRAFAAEAATGLPGERAQAPRAK